MFSKQRQDQRKSYEHFEGDLSRETCAEGTERSDTGCATHRRTAPSLAAKLHAFGVQPIPFTYTLV